MYCGDPGCGSAVGEVADPRHPSPPQNSEGQTVDLYIPRKCSATNRLIQAKDHGSVQINIAHVDANGTYTVGPLSESPGNKQEAKGRGVAAARMVSWRRNGSAAHLRFECVRERRQVCVSERVRERGMSVADRWNTDPSRRDAKTLTHALLLPPSDSLGWQMRLIDFVSLNSRLDNARGPAG